MLVLIFNHKGAAGENLRPPGAHTHIFAMPRPNLFRFSALLGAACLFTATGLHAATESFDTFAQTTFTSLNTAVGTLSATSGTTSITTASGSGGIGASPKLRLHGGASPGTVATLTPASAYAKAQAVTFNAERWTSTNPFTFKVEALNASNVATTLYTGDTTVAVGANTAVSCLAPAGTAKLRFTCTSPANTGVLIDNLAVADGQPYTLTAVETYQPVAPVLIRKTDNPVVAINIKVSAPLNDAPNVSTVSVNLAGTTDLADLANLRLVYTGATKDYVDGATATTAFGAALAPASTLTFAGSQKLANGDNWFWVMAEPTATADLDHRVDAGIDSALLSDATLATPTTPNPAGTQRIGYALRKRNDDGSTAYRIPGLCTSLNGTLIAVYDIRYNGGGDLPANIDVGVSRSTDGGQTWSPMGVAMTIPADMRVGSSNGVGDPTVFVDKVSGRIWVSALWASNGKAYSASAPGIDPAVTGQLVLAYSDDDGLTWSRPYSITPMVKDPSWRLLFNGPGSAITKADGTLVMPVQYRLGDAGGTVYSSIIYSRDHGLTWSIAKGAMPRTNEAQVAELTDGSLYLNCRSEAGGGLRRVATTRNFGATWSVVTPRTGANAATDASLLIEPTCQGGLFRFDHPTYGPAFYFSNPSSQSGRNNMTIKVSQNNGRTWPYTLRTLYDYRTLNGYSSLSNIGDTHLGVLYEGRTEIWFLRIPFSELLGK